MSFNIFENTNLDFDVSLIKMSRTRDETKTLKDVIESTTPIDPAAVLSLDLRESSLAMGFAGSITINNKFKILDNLDITTNSPHEVYIAIKITDLDLQQIADIPAEDKCITLIGFISNTSSGAINIIDTIVIFEFEEAFIAALKQTQTLRNFYDEDNIDVISLANKFNANFFKLRDNDVIVTADSVTTNIKHNIKTAFNNHDGDDPSIYDAMQEMLKETTAGEVVYDKPGRVSFFRFVNRLSDFEDDNSEVIRQLQFGPFLSDRHLQFVRSVLEYNFDGDYSDVYTEKFTLGPLAEASGDPNTNLYNNIESYNISRANTSKLKETIWGDYRLDKIIPGQDLAPFSPSTKHFSQIQQDFIKINLPDLPVGLNLPVFIDGELKDFHIDFNATSSDNDVDRSRIQNQNKIANLVHKSFLTIVETITFKVKGSVIRRPNTFIWIENGKEEEPYKKLWYINSVEHVFASGKYTTKIVATKIFGNVTLDDFGFSLANQPLGGTDLPQVPPGSV